MSETNTDLLTQGVDMFMEEDGEVARSHLLVLFSLAVELADRGQLLRLEYYSRYKNAYLEVAFLAAPKSRELHYRRWHACLER